MIHKSCILLFFFVSGDGPDIRSRTTTRLPRPEHGIVEQMFGAADSVAMWLADTHVHCRLAEVEPWKVAALLGGKWVVEQRHVGQELIVSGKPKWKRWSRENHINLGVIIFFFCERQHTFVIGSCAESGGRGRWCDPPFKISMFFIYVY